jgi:DHA3 family tetracycline resistance protein-like MFS transporter
MLVLFGLSPALPGVVIAALIFGVGISLGGIVWTNTVQEMVPQEKLGRVTSIDALGSFVFLPVGFALAGLLVERIGPASVFVLGGSLVIALSLAILLVPSIRNLD